MTRNIDRIRNIAIIAHVDHGKTTLVDKLLQQAGAFGSRAALIERAMDSNDLERERGITILAKNTALDWRDYRINIVDTPGHADFGGEVERALSMVDAVLLVVDAVDGPMPQTRFVTQKAFALGLSPIVVINKIDRPGARPDWVLNATFDLFDRLGATTAQLDFPVVYTAAIHGYAGLTPEIRTGDMTPLFQTIVEYVPPPAVDPAAPFQMQISALDYSSYIGTIGIGRITRGQARTNMPVVVIDRNGARRTGRILQLFGLIGLKRIELTHAAAGDIIAITGLDPLYISDTLCDPQRIEARPALEVDAPTVQMSFEVNNSPFAGRDGKFITSRHLRERLKRELIHNVALRVIDTVDPDKFRVAGRGVLHLSILIENMRREGYELAVSRPQVIFQDSDGITLEPYETLVVDLEEIYQGAVMERLGNRKADLVNIIPDNNGRVRLDYVIPSRGLIGFHSEFLSLTSGSGLIYHIFDHYDVIKKGIGSGRNNGVLIANNQGKSVAYALFNLQERGRLFISPGEDIYEGMIVGIHARDNDLVVNPLKEKQLTNIRAAGSDENIILTPAQRLSLEQALEFINDDELVEITPHHLRLRKRFLKEHERRRATRAAGENRV